MPDDFTLNQDAISVVIVDDHPLFREGVSNSLKASSDFNVLAEGSNKDDAVRLAQTYLPDLMLVDITMPGGGINAVAAISAICPVTKIIMLTVSEEEDSVLAALKAGARGYILKGVSSSELRDILRAVYKGGLYITPLLAASVLMEMAENNKSEQPISLLEELTNRERQILELVAEGQTNKAIGDSLGITEKTVKHYMSNILEKLHVRNRVEAALMMAKLG